MRNAAAGSDHSANRSPALVQARVEKSNGLTTRICATTLLGDSKETGSHRTGSGKIHSVAILHALFA
jgi:hypothetical protein